MGRVAPITISAVHYESSRIGAVRAAPPGSTGQEAPVSGPRFWEDVTTTAASGHSAGQWYTLQTKPRKEFMVSEHLASRGIETYLPLLPPDGKRSARARRAQPFFARYLFARLDLSTVPLSSINWSQGMVGVVSFGGQPAVVDEQVIRWLKARLAQMDPATHYQGLPLTPGAHLRVAAGPLRGMEAIFDRRLSGEDRARVLVQLLGQITACEIPLSWLEQIG